MANNHEPPSRPFNWQIWAALLLSLSTFFSFRLVFIKWPLTRDVPWPSLVLIGLSGAALVAGVRRSFAPGRLRALRGIVGAVIGLASAAVLAGFVFMVFIAARRLPASQGAPQVGQKAPDFNLIDANSIPVSLSSLLASPIGVNSAGPQPHRSVLLVFYMYSGCLACNSELRSIQQSLDDLKASGVRPVAISNDAPEISHRLAQDAGYTFTFLSDPNADLIRKFDLFDEDMRTARPAVFLLDSSGTVRWRLITPSYYIRSRPQQILDAAKALN